MKIIKTKNYKLVIDGGKHALTILNYPILYRFFRPTDYNIKSFIKNEICVSTPSTFNDPYDTALIYTEKGIETFLFNEFRQLLHNNVDEKAKDFFYEKLNETFIALRKIRDLYGIACFSESVNHEIMWAHYSEQAKGFALAYESKDLNDLANNFQKDYLTAMNNERQNFNLDSILKQIMFSPVVYSNKKYNLTPIFLEMLKQTFQKKEMSFNDELSNYLNSKSETNIIIHNTMLYSKNKDWGYEKEWRLVVNHFDIENTHFPIGRLKAKALYLGQKMDEELKDLLLCVAFDKGIPTFEMKTKVKNGTLKLVPELKTKTKYD